jgi:hypothetical protein
MPRSRWLRASSRSQAFQNTCTPSGLVSAAAGLVVKIPASMRQHTSAYVSIRQHTSAYVSIRQHTSAYVSIRQHTSAYVILILLFRGFIGGFIRGTKQICGVLKY